MKIILLVIFLTSNLLFAQIPSERLVDWSNAGVKSKIKYDKTIEIDANELMSDETSNSDLINDIIKDNVGQSIQIILPVGKFTFDKTINLPSIVGIKGAGADKTELVFDLGGRGHCFQAIGKNTFIDIKLISDVKKGDKKLILEKTLFVEEGDWISIIENDRNLVTSEWAYGTVAQIQQITRISGDTLFFDSEFRKDFLVDSVAGFKRIDPVENVSIECLKINRVDNTAPEQSSNISFNYTVNSSVKNIESEFCTFSHFQARNSSNLEILNSYFHDSHDFGGGGRGYGIMLHISTGEVLVENNIFRKLRHSMIVQAGANGNVFAYNYSTEPFWDGTSLPENSAGDMVLHGNYVFSNLFEGNICQNIVIDNSHGPNGPLNTFFRNRAELWGIFFSANNSPKQNIIANEITNQSFPYSLVNYTILGDEHFLFANNNKGEITPDTNEDLNISSLYYQEKPEFLSANQFGGIGYPQEEEKNQIPAMERYISNEINLACEEGINNIENKLNHIKIYPNPANEYIYIQGIKVAEEIYIMNLLGQKYKINSSLNNDKIDISFLKKGVYIILIDNQQFKFIKN